MSDNLLGILIPSYNRPEFIKQTLDSILINTSREDQKTFEIIISDDNSPRQQEIKNIVEDFSNSNIRFYLQKSNLGEAKNRRFLLEKCQSEYTLFLCDDDTLVVDWLKTITKEIQNYKPDLLFFGYNLINENNNILRSRGALFNLKISNQNAIKHIINFQDFPYWYFSPVSFISKRTILNTIKPSSDVGIADDLALIAEILLKLNLNSIISAKRIINYRKFGNQFEYDQKNQSEDLQHQKDGLFLLYKYLLTLTSDLVEINTYLLSENFIFNLLLRNTERKLISNSNVLSSNEKISFLRLKSKNVIRDNSIISKMYRLRMYLIFHLKNYVRN